jgi:hypothetical protein
LQEEEADLSVDDLMQLQYEVPNDEELDVEAREMLEMESGGQQGGNSSSRGSLQKQQVSGGAEDDDEEVEDVSQTVLPRRQMILLEILAAAATDADLEGKIAEYADEIDDELLDLLQQRIDVISKVGPGRLSARMHWRWNHRGMGHFMLTAAPAHTCLPAS